MEEVGALGILLRAGLDAQAEIPCREFDGVSWPDLYAMAASQGVSAFAWDGACRLPAAVQPPRALRLQWAYNVEQIEMRYRRQWRAAAELARIYAENGIRTVVLKGFAVSRLYPRPEHRPCGDLDCFLGAGYERGNTLAAAAGAKVDADYYKHSHIVFRGLTVENHRFCTAIRGSRQAKAFERHLQSILASQPCPPILGTDLLAPPADFNALFLTKHALLHFLTEGISLRHLCDWALFVDRQGEQVDWPEFRRVAAEHGLLRFAGVMTRLAVRLLGVKEDVFPVDAALDPLADRVLSNMLYERRHLNDTAGNVWVKRFRMVAGIWHDRWKYRDIYQRSVCREIFRFMSGFLVERKPEI